MPRSRATEHDREARRRADRDRLEQAARGLLQSEGWQRWVRVRARNGLGRYSFNNQLLIASQRPGATYVAGFRAFLELNRCVRKGERAIRILAPMSLRVRSTDPPQTQEGTSPEQPVKRTFFRVVSVFDVSQTEPLPNTDPVPLEPPSEPITGDSQVHLLPVLEDLACALGYEVSRHPLIDDSADGWCDFKAARIVVNSALAANGQVRVLVHEIAHVLGITYADYGRRRSEVLVDTITYIVCSSVGLDTGGSSIPYVAGWGAGGALDAIREFAQTIDRLSRRIEDVIQPQGARAGAPASQVTTELG
jgi:hypothetical protein